MAASTAETKADPPALDPIAILGKLKDLVSSNKDPSTGGGKSWVGTLILIAVSLIGVAVWAWISWRRNQELARLRHEAFVTKVNAEQAVVDQKIAANDAKIEASKMVVAEAEEKIRVIDSDTRAEEARYAADLRAINAVRSWRDVDPSVR